MWEVAITQIIQNIVVPEIANFIKKRYLETGKWPTESELKEQVNSLANQIKTEGQAFLNRNDSFIKEFEKGQN
jgi:uncharacterized protein YeaC (DUF1315 family)